MCPDDTRGTAAPGCPGEPNLLLSYFGAVCPGAVPLFSFVSRSCSARAALPKLQQATEQLNRINAMAAQLPESSRKDLASVVGASMPALNRLCDQALSNPQIAGLAKPTIDALRAKLQTLAQG